MENDGAASRMSGAVALDGAASGSSGAALGTATPASSGATRTLDRAHAPVVARSADASAMRRPEACLRILAKVRIRGVGGSRPSGRRKRNDVVVRSTLRKMIDPSLSGSMRVSSLVVVSMLAPTDCGLLQKKQGDAAAAAADAAAPTVKAAAAAAIQGAQISGIGDVPA